MVSIIVASSKASIAQIIKSSSTNSVATVNSSKVSTSTIMIQAT